MLLAVVVAYRVIGRGKGSGVPIDQRIAVHWTLRHGKMWRGQVCLDPAEALEAVGI